MSYAQKEEFLKARDHPNVTYLDVRSPEEIAAENPLSNFSLNILHYPCTLQQCDDKLTNQTEEIIPDKEGKLLNDAFSEIIYQSF